MSAMVGSAADDDAAAKSLASKLSNVDVSDLRECKRVFDSADRDSSGHINIGELRELLEKLTGRELSDVDHEKLMEKYDCNKDGMLSFEEFVEVFCKTPINKVLRLERMIETEGRRTQKNMAEERADPEKRALEEGVPVNAVIAYLKKELGEMQSCIALPGTFILFLSYTLAVLFHERIDILHSIDTAVSFDVIENANFAWSGQVPFENGRMGHKSVLDVNSYADFWSWFGTGIVPLFWAEGWDVSEARTNTVSKCTAYREALKQFGWSRRYDFGQHSTGDEPQISGVCPEGDDPPEAPFEFFGHDSTEAIKGTYLYFNTVIGGLRLRQERTNRVECPAGESRYMQMMHLGHCAPSLDYWLKPELRKGIQFASEYEPNAGENGDTVYLLSRTPQAEIRKQLRDLENRAWLGPETAKVEILFTTYNAHVDAMTATYLVFFQNRAGHIHRMIVPMTFWVNPYHGWWCYAADFVWLACVLKIFLEESYEIIKACWDHGLLKGLREYCTFHRTVDWLNIGYGIVLVYMFCEHLSKIDDMKGLMEQAVPGLQGSWEDPAIREAFFAQIENIIGSNEYRYLCLALYPFVLVARFFKSFAAQPRLSLVTNTLTKAWVDLVHFGLVFAVVFLMFSFSAQMLFGRSIAEFANEGRALHTTFLSLLGDWDWEDMTEVGRLPATVWFWCYQWLVNMIMLNMLLAIIMDLYTEVKGAIGSDAETFWSQTREIFRRWHQRKMGMRVSLDLILEHLNNYKKDRRSIQAADEEEIFAKMLEAKGADLMEEQTDTLIKVELLVKIVPGLSEKQAKRVLVASMNQLEFDLQKSRSLSDAMLDIQRIEKRLTQLHQSTQSLIHMSEMTTTLMVEGDRNHPKAGGTNAHVSRGSDDHAGAQQRAQQDASQETLQRLETMMQQQSDLWRQQAEAQAQQQRVQQQQAEVMQQLGSRVGNLELLMSRLVTVLEASPSTTTRGLPRPGLCSEPQVHQGGHKLREAVYQTPNIQSNGSSWAATGQSNGSSRGA